MSQSKPVALITGAKGGIGVGIAVELAKRGFDLALTDINTVNSRHLMKVIEPYDARAQMFKCDLADTDSHEKLLADVLAWGGPISTLVNSAGIGSPSRGDLLDIAPNSLDLVLNVNLRGTFFLTQAVAKHMLDTESDHPRSIITVSSVSAEMASIERAEYCISKAGLSMMIKLFALRLAELGVGVFEVRPGIIRTPMTEGVATKYDQRIADGLVPTGRWGYPKDVAGPVATLASGEFAFSTGSIINVDGALSIQRF